MPPEYIDKQEITPKFDVFSLGVIILQIMAGKSGHSVSVDTPSDQFIELVRKINFLPSTPYVSICKATSYL
jgi:serine/threonine protein kinase